MFGSLLAASFSLSAAAQPPRTQAPNWEADNPVLQGFNSFFRETEPERQAIENIPIDAKTERQIGDADMAAYLKSLKSRQIRVTQRGPDFDYVSSLVDQIHPRLQHAKQYSTIRVYIANTPETDAHAFPGGSIVVMTGLIDFTHSEAALVGVLGHELSHIDHGHQLRMARAAGLAQRGWQNGMASPQAMQTNLLTMAKNFARPFRQEDEAVADHDGATWAFELGYQPAELAKLFDRFDERPGPAAGPVFVPSFLLTHPSYQSRSATIRDLAADLQRRSPGAKLYVGRTNLEKRVPRTAKEFGD